MLAKPGIVAKFSVKITEGSNRYTPTTIVLAQDGTNTIVNQSSNV